MSANSGERSTGCDSPVKVDRSTSTAPASRRASAETRSPSANSSTSPGTSARASITPALPVAADSESLLGQVAGQRLDRPFCLQLLCEREQGIEHDHGDDRSHRAPGVPTDEGERPGEPEQQRERMDKLCGELARPASAAASAQLVRPICDEATLRFTTGEPLWARPQISQEEIDRLPRVTQLFDG